ncbi:MAG: DUF262 domain-containing protein [Betaproteobacteria bacterium]|nr:MAG: DUF262 domain-containing protein [Betaproteobacteria bacterium]
MKPAKTSAIDLYSSPIQYAIPVFQRGFVWTLERQVSLLWEDIEDATERTLEREAVSATVAPNQLAPLQKHFLGSVVLTPVRNAFGRAQMLEVIDGQQRITTLHLLLLAFKHVAASNADLSQLDAMLKQLLVNAGPYTEQEDSFKVWPTQSGRAEIAALHQAANASAVCAAYPARKDNKRQPRPLLVEAYLYLHQMILAYLNERAPDDPVENDKAKTVSERVIQSIRADNVVWSPVNGKPHSQAVERAQALYMALKDTVQVMTLTLEDDDNPQIIFETLNARGEPLLSSDLIRNLIFLEIARAKRPVDVLYKKYWSDFDGQDTPGKQKKQVPYWREVERQGRLLHPRVDLFFFHFTTLRTIESVKLGNVFQSFKQTWQLDGTDVETKLDQIATSSKHFRTLISPSGRGIIAEFGRLVKAIEVGTLSPVYLFLRNTYAENSQELTQTLSDIASFITRRAVCGLTTKSYNRLFLKLLRALIDAKNPAAPLRTELLALSGDSQRWPDDDEFKRAWLERPVYQELKSSCVVAILRSLEVNARSARQETVEVPESHTLTVEHVLPQSWREYDHYPLPSQLDAEKQQQAETLRQNRLHTFGNLTLLSQSLNSAIGNGPFLDFSDSQGVAQNGKRTSIAKDSILLMNNYFQNTALATWDDATIKSRGETLFEQARLHWARPLA